MRPLRLVIDGFGSYREPADILLSDVDFFVLTGPTGSGKSTVIDALCFALYGTVPRWGKENVIKNALAPSAGGCRVCLVFEAVDRRYVVVRRLARNTRGVVQTKDARIERIDHDVPVDAELDRLLEASVEQVAEGTGVTAAVTDLLGIGYEHFTQCVLLPQGRFAEFLNAKPGDRQDLLIQLLAYAVYEDVGKRARERETLAKQRLTLIEKQLAEVGTVTADHVTAAERTITTFTDLVPVVEGAVAELDELDERRATAAARTAEQRQHVTALAGLRLPTGVHTLAAQLAAADDRVDRGTTELERLEQDETEAERQLTGLPEQAVLERWRDAHQRRAGLADELASARERQASAERAEADLATRHERAVTDAADADAVVAATQRDNQAASLVTHLHIGAPCPVCLQPVLDLPQHDLPGDLTAAQAAARTARTTAAELQSRLIAAGKATATARHTTDTLDRRLAEADALLAQAPAAHAVDADLRRRAAAEAAVARAREATRAVRTELRTARREREQLGDAEQRAWAALREARDGFVVLSAPPVEGSDLAAAWQSLLDWAHQQRAAVEAEASRLAADEETLRTSTQERTAELTGLLRAHSVPCSDVRRAPIAVATRLESANRDLRELRARQERAAGLRCEADTAREESEVAGMLGNLLRSNGFERWLCAEALDQLVLEASGTLMQLSGGQYELDRDERNEFVVIDHDDAGARRPVNTLSGGETFQASLALALALSRQVMGLSGGRRRLDAMFLDEGFGTLDEATLDTVASTLESLVERTGSMIGVITHVPALAERVPVQFAVSRSGASSRVTRADV